MCLLIALICSNVYLYGRLHNCVSEPIRICDTIYVDSILIEEKTRVEYITQFDTCFIVTIDSIVDSVYVLLPIEHKIYNDTIKNDSIDINVLIGYLGYKTKIDSINMTYTTHFSVPQKKPSRLGYGFSIGPCVSYGPTIIGNEVKVGPLLGISIQFGLLYNMRKNNAR